MVFVSDFKTNCIVKPQWLLYRHTHTRKEKYSKKDITKRRRTTATTVTIKYRGNSSEKWKRKRNSIINNNGKSVCIQCLRTHCNPIQNNPLYHQSMFHEQTNKKHKTKHKVHVLTASIYNIITDMLCVLCVCQWWCMAFMFRLSFLSVIIYFPSFFVVSIFSVAFFLCVCFIFVVWVRKTAAGDHRKLIKYIFGVLLSYVIYSKWILYCFLHSTERIKKVLSKGMNNILTLPFRCYQMQSDENESSQNLSEIECENIVEHSRSDHHTYTFLFLSRTSIFHIPNIFPRHFCLP